MKAPTNDRGASQRAHEAAHDYPLDARGFTDTDGGGKYLGLSSSTMNKARHYGTGPEFVKFGAAVRYSYAALDSWATKQRRTCTRDEPEADASAGSIDAAHCRRDGRRAADRPGRR